MSLEIFNNIFFCFRFIFGLFAFIILLSTIYDVWIFSAKVDSYHSVFLAFSVYSNTKKFFALDDASKQLPYLNGLKSISTITIVIIHSFMSFFMGPIDNIYDFYHVSTLIFLIFFLIFVFSVGKFSRKRIYVRN